MEETLDLILEDKLEVGENFTTPIEVAWLGNLQDRNMEDKFNPDIDYKNDLGPLSWKMITYTGFEKDISKTLGREALDYMNFNFSKLHEDLFLACVGGWVPVKKVLHNLVSSKKRESAVDDKDLMYDLTDSSEEENIGSIFESPNKPKRSPVRNNRSNVSSDSLM